MEHSKVVGGSTCKRVMRCPGSVALVNKMPPAPSNKYADEGTLLHNAMDRILSQDVPPRSVIGMEYNGIVLTEELYENKIAVALAALDAIDPDGKMEYQNEARVGFGDLIPGAFGTTDLLGKLDGRAIILDWKFGDGVPVPAEENEQLMYYAAAAMRTQATQWAFQDSDDVELIIVQPPSVKRWTTTINRIKAFEYDLVKAVEAAQLPDAALEAGDHCRFCPAKPICPLMTGAVERALQARIKDLPAVQIGAFLQNADILEQWIKDLRALAFQMMEKDIAIPGYKLVAKRATRQWHNESNAKAALLDLGLAESDVMVSELISPAQAEKLLKKKKLQLPDDQVVAISSGSTLVPEDDPRPPVLQIGKQLNAALSKIVQ